MISRFADFWNSLFAEKNKYVYKVPPRPHLKVLSKISPYWAFRFFSGNGEMGKHRFPAIYYDEYDKAFTVVGPECETMVPTLAHAMIVYQEKFKKQCADAEESWIKKINRSR